jgi:CheY-like chemotaxis protein
VLLNLLANAIKYSGTGGSVAVDAATLPDGRLRIAVTDSGPGIPAGRAGEVFGWFERLGREAGDIDGVGIGLALCQDLVTRMDGVIGFDNHAAGGCTFRVDLPLSGPVDETGAEPVDEPGATPLSKPVAGTVVASAAAGPKRRRRILYIDDSEDLLALMETAFAALLPDCDLRVARNAESGIATVAAWRPDVVLMDVNLPGMDGIAAARRLKDDPATAGIPVIAATGAVTDHDQTRTQDAGFFAVLSKPFQIEKLFVVIDQALDATVRRGNEDPNANGAAG